MLPRFDIATTPQLRLQVEGDLCFDTLRAEHCDAGGLWARDLAPGAQLWIDLSKIGRADSAGLALLLHWLARAAQRKLTTRVESVPESLRGLARISEVEDWLGSDLPAVGRA